MDEPLFRLSDPLDHTFAQAGRRGTWQSTRPGLCPECTRSFEERVSPLVIEWEPGSDVVGDFTWPGLDSDVVLSPEAARTLTELDRTIQLGPVEMIEPSGRVRRRDRRVALPYEGPPLFDLIPTQWVNLDRDRSSVTLERSCGTCGRDVFRVTGVESWSIRWDQRRRIGYQVHTAREAGQGIFVWAEDLGEAAIFRIRETPSWIFATARVREAVLAAHLTNVWFLDCGAVLSRG